MYRIIEKSGTEDKKFSIIILDFDVKKLYNQAMNKNKTILKEHQKLNNFPFHIETWQPNASVPVHYHDCAEMIFTISGTALSHIDNFSLEVKKGDLFVISGDIAHTILDLQNFKAYRVLFDLSLLNELNNEIKSSPGYTALFLMSNVGYINHSYYSCVHIDNRFFERTTRIFDELLFEYNSDLFADNNYLMLCFHSLVGLILKCYNYRVKRKNNLIEPSLQIFLDHFNEKINVAEIAESFGITERYFRHLFTEFMHISPAQFIMNLRMRKAKTLLALSDISITEIAMTCGFCDNSHFSNTFTKVEGVSPREYRNQNKKAE